MWSGWFLIGVSVGMLVVGITWEAVNMAYKQDDLVIVFACEMCGWVGLVDDAPMGLTGGLMCPVCDGELGNVFFSAYEYKVKVVDKQYYRALKANADSMLDKRASEMGKELSDMVYKVMEKDGE